jgi:hypothetical protein
MTDELEREVRAMLQSRAGEMPTEFPAPPRLAARVARRRAAKLALVGTGVAVLIAVAAAGVAAATKPDDKNPRVITSSVPTTVEPPTTVATPLTRKTTPSTPPTVAIAGVGCPTSSVTAPFDLAAPAVGTRAIYGVEPAVVARVRSYVGPRAGFATDSAALEPDVVLGPKDWSCRVYRSNGGGAVMYVFPPSAKSSFGAADSWATSEKYSGAEVRVVTAVLGHDPDASLACAVFASHPLVKRWMTTSNIATSCAVPAGRVVTRLAAGVYAFVDADGTRGVGVMRVRTTTPQLDGDYGIVTCRLTGADASLCDAIIADYSTRYPGLVPATVPSSQRGIVTTAGRVGSLQFGKSTEADVRAMVGTPDATLRASFSAPGYPEYDALGYDCSTTAAPGKTALVVQPAVRGPYCATIYFVNTAKKTLAAFETTSPNYATESGTTVGMTPADAQQREGRQLIPHGCEGSFIQVGSFPYDRAATPTDAVELIFVGPSTKDDVWMIATESNVNPVGLLFC